MRDEGDVHAGETGMVTLDLSRGWRIISPSADPVAACATAELAETLDRIAGGPYPAAEGGLGMPSLNLSHGEDELDGFTWQASPEQVALRGDNPRGLLYAVYSFLEALGCRWVAPGAEGERLPRGTRFELPAALVREQAALPGRCLIVGHYAFMDAIEDWIVWAARSRLNTIFLHVIEGPLALGAAPAWQWQAHKARAVPLARQRGMTIEHGGHGLAELLPRGRSRELPEAYRYHAGQRTPDHNFCPSSKEGMAIVRRNAEAYFRAHPEVDVYHLWPDDIPGGGWCACEGCRPYTSSEQALLAVNAVAEVLAEVKPAARIAFLAYMDTEAVPVRVTPRENVCLCWAPRSRCYAHATDNPACAVNVPHYAETFRTQAAHFPHQPRAFEYYLDAVLFKSLLPPLPSVMQRDLRFYREAGAHTVQALMTGDHPWLAPQLNAWLFARLSWDPEQDLDALLVDFCRATYGAVGELPAYYRALEAAFGLALDIVPEQVDREIGLTTREQLKHPWADMGDPAYAPPEVLREKRQANAAIEPLLQQAAQALGTARGAAAAAGLSGAWEAERTEFELAQAWLRFDLARLRLYDAVARTPIAWDARERYVEATAALRVVTGWGKAHIDDRRYRLNFLALHEGLWRLQLERVRAEHLSGVGWVWRLWGALRVAWFFRRVRGMYNS
jgi:hypothetical protein